MSANSLLMPAARHKGSLLQAAWWYWQSDPGVLQGALQQAVRQYCPCVGEDSKGSVIASKALPVVLPQVAAFVAP